MTGLERQVKYKQKHPERVAAASARWRVKNPGYQLEYLYDITIEEYNLLYEQQQGCCAICKRPQKTFKKKLDTDHCHETGKVRGLLCTRCNTRLEYFKEFKNEIDKYLNR